MCVPNSPLFQHCQVYDWPPFFQQKVYEWPDFSGFLYEKPHFSDIQVYAHFFFAQRFFKAAYLLVLWIDCDICVITSKKWVQKIKGQYMNRSTFWMIKYMNGSVFSKARYMNGVGFEILARTPVPKLPLSYPPPPPPPTPPPPPSFRAPRKFFGRLKETKFRDTLGFFPLFHTENVCCMYSLESPHRYTQHTIIS